MSKKGLSIIITTYKRSLSLLWLLRGLRKQNVNFPLEIIVLNDNPEIVIQKSLFGLLDKELKALDAKIINNKKNLGCSVRYSYVSEAKYQMVMFLDDDVKILSHLFLDNYVETLNQFGKNTILSAWCSRLCTKKGMIYSIPINFYTSHDRITKVDLVGPGISIFYKTLVSGELSKPPKKYWNIDNVWFPIMATVIKSSEKYYIPSKDLVSFSIFYRNLSAMWRGRHITQEKEEAIIGLIKEFNYDIDKCDKSNSNKLLLGKI
jgi:glycosyltransferase involved in cell wall biosynthesis